MVAGQVRTRPPALFWFAVPLALSVGWGIRGNFGHEFGAMIPGALAGMAVPLLAGRPDWWRRVAPFGLFGALGWSFGGSQSYMQVIGYTHSGDSISVLYGFACLFLIGFLWAAPGGFGTALPAVLDRKDLDRLIAPMAAVFAAWFAEEVWLEPYLRSRGYCLDWFDTDWLGAAVAVLVAILWALMRRRIDLGTSLILHIGIGWWVGFLVLVVGLGFRMTPPRGDNWAGCLGLVGGLLLFCRTAGREPLALPTVVTGFVGGIGFSTAAMLKLVEVRSGWDTNWHSILEQTTGLFNGIGLAIALALVSSREPEHAEKDRPGRIAEVFAVGFVLLAVTYLNLRKAPAIWVKSGHFPGTLHGFSTSTWFNLGYLALTLAILLPILRHARRPLPIVPRDPVGRGQLLFLVFLWWIVLGNLIRAIPGFAAERLVTEGVIHLDAAILTILLLMGGGARSIQSAAVRRPFRLTTGRAWMIGSLAALAWILVNWGVVRCIYGDQFAGHAGLHIRFGPRSTATSGPP